MGHLACSAQVQSTLSLRDSNRDSLPVLSRIGRHKPEAVELGLLPNKDVRGHSDLDAFGIIPLRVIVDLGGTFGVLSQSEISD